MSTLRISNIEAKSVPASATVDEKVKITNSSGDVLVFLDGKTSGITTVGINTTDGNITFDANSNVVVTGIITATKFVGAFEPTDLPVSGDLSIADKIIHTGDTNTAIRFPAADTITAETGGSERLRIDSTGALGLSITPKNNSGNFRQLQIGLGAHFYGRTDDTPIHLVSNGYRDGSDWKYTANTTASKISMGTNIVFSNAASGTAGNAISFSERLRIDTNGRLLIGTTTAGSGGADELTIATSGDTGMTIRSGTSSAGGIYFSDGTSGGDQYRGVISYNHANNFMRFYTDATEKVRIDSSGRLLVGSAAMTYNQSPLYVSGTDPVVATFHHSDGGTNDEARIALGALVNNPPYQRGVYLTAKNNGNGHDFIVATSASHAAGPSEKLRITSAGTVSIGGDYSQTTNGLYVQGTPGIKAQGGSGGSGNAVLLELKHSDTSSSTSGGGAGDGPAMLFNGFYAGNPWQFAKVCSVNSGSGYGAAFQLHVHPSNGSQGASLIKAVTIVGNGSGANVTIHNGTLQTTYNGSSMYGAQINDSQTSGTHIQFQRQGYNNGNITHSTNSCSYNTSGSDRTLKKNFEDWTENTLDLFKSLKPQKFHFIIDNDSDPKSKGYIAQDLVDSFPEAYPKEVKSQKYMFNPSGMVVYLMKALQEEIAKREELEARITDLEGS